MKTINSKIITSLLLLFIVAFLTGCKKKEEITTYQIINNVDSYSTTDQYLNGTLWEVVVYCYIGSDIVRQDNITSVSPSGGKSDLIEVEPTYEKVKVSFQLLPPSSPNYNVVENRRLYVVAYTVLGKGKNNIITITSSTQVGTTLTMTNSQINIGIAFENAKENFSK